MSYDGNSIFALNVANPNGTEAKSLGDNAIREIKRALKTSFPGAILGDSYTGTLAQLTAAVAAITPRGVIVPWSGNQLVLPYGPVGWSICDGRPRKTGGGTTPDLRGRFIMAAYPVLNQAGATNPLGVYPPPTGASGGSTDLPTPAGTVGGTTLTLADIPAHRHFIAKAGGSRGGGSLGADSAVAQSGGGDDNFNQYNLGNTQLTGEEADVGITSPKGGGGSHTHPLTLTAPVTGANLPPWYSVLYIIKD
jgi:hypothetical protein